MFRTALLHLNFDFNFTPHNSIELKATEPQSQMYLKSHKKTKHPQNPTFDHHHVKRVQNSFF